MGYRDMYQGRTLQVGDAAYIRDGYSSYMQITKGTVTKVTKTMVTVEWGTAPWAYTVNFRWSEADEVYREVKAGVSAWNKDYLVTEAYAAEQKAAKDRETRRNSLRAEARTAAGIIQNRHLTARELAEAIAQLQAVLPLLEEVEKGK